MKKLSLLIISFFIIFSSASVSLAELSILDGGSNSIHLCQGDECGLEQGINLIEDSGIDGVVTEGTASEYIQRIVVYILTFLQLAAVVIIIYAGFNMLTAAGDEEKAKKSKTIITFAVIGLAIIFLAGPITTFVLDLFTQTQ